MVAIAGGALLAFATFLPWYQVVDAGALLPEELQGAFRLRGGSISAWRAFDGMDVLLFGCGFLGAGLGIGLLVDAADRTMTPALHVLGGIAIALVLYRIAVQPEPAQLYALRFGCLAALVGAILLAAGPALPGVLSRRR